MKCLRLILVALGVSSISFAQSVIDFIPSEVGAVVRIEALTSTLGDVESFVDRIQPGAGQMASMQLSNLLGGMISNPSFDGVDQSRDWYVAYFDSGAVRDAVLILPVTDAEAARDALKSSTKTFVHNGWLVGAQKEEVLQQVKQAAGDPSKALKMKEKDAERFLSSHVGLYVNGTSLKSAYADQLASAEDQLDAALEQIRSQLEAQMPTDMGYVIDMYSQLGRAMIQLIRDSETVVLALDLKESGLQLDKWVEVPAGTESQEFIAGQPVAELTEMENISEDNDAVFGMSVDPKPIFSFSEQLMASMFKDTDVKEQASKSIAIMREVDFGAYAGGMVFTDDTTGALNFSAVVKAAPASKMKEAFALFTEVQEYEVAGIKQSMQYREGAEKIGDTLVDLYQVKQELPAQLDPTGMQKKMMEKMYGPDGITQRLAFNGDTLHMTMGGGLAAMKTSLETKSWNDGPLKAARALQLKTATMVTLFDLPSQLRQLFKLVIDAQIAPIQVPREFLDRLDLPRSFIGTSVALRETEIEARLHVPVETIQAFIQLGMMAQGMMTPAN